MSIRFAIPSLRDAPRVTSGLGEEESSRFADWLLAVAVREPICGRQWVCLQYTSLIAGA